MVCRIAGWSRDWKEGGCALHLEVSEFIEALRKKRGDIIEEAGDILFVLLSILADQDIDIERVFDRMDQKRKELLGRLPGGNIYSD